MKTIGIDLGTTNSLVAYWTDEGARIIPNVLGSNLTPSIVSVDENGEIYVGQIAKERLITHPSLTAAAFKRYMGTDKRYKLGRYKFTPEELSSFVIRSLKSDAEAFLNEEVVEAVISVPAYFNDAQRKATKRAAELAGLKVERLISEPTAAAVSYGLHQEESETKFLVFDLGGGTFDVSVLELFEGVMEVQSIAGDNFLGGEDFTKALIDHFLQANEITEDTLDKKTYSLLYKQAEQCKYDLSRNKNGKMSIILDKSSEDKLQVEVSKENFEKITAGLLLRLRQPIEKALRDADISPEELDAIILIGGATRMPVVKSVVSRMFNKLPYTNINPDEAVALGAAIQAALKERNEALSEVILTDVCPYSLGTSIAKRTAQGFEEGFFAPIIERNTTIPVSRVERFFTLVDNQTTVRIGIYQGESRRVDNNIKLGELMINLPPGPAGSHAIDIRYTYDINGILEVETTTLHNGVKKNMIIEKNKGSLSETEIKERLKALEAIKIHPRDRAENKLLLARCERMYEEALGELRDYISLVTAEFEEVLATQDQKKINPAAEKLKKVLDEIDGRFHF